MPTPALTDVQIKAAFDSLKIHGNKIDAAAAIGISRGALQHRIRTGEARGYSPEHNMNHMAAAGYLTKGTSTLYDPDGNMKMQWVKTSRDAEQQQIALQEAIKAMSEDVPRIKPSKETPKDTADTLMTIYPVGDHHMGMLAWNEETGGKDYNIEISENLLNSAMQHLVDASPPAKESAILVLGDFLHYNTLVPTTKSGHILDADSRYPQVVRAAIRCIRFIVDAALKKHETVRLVLEKGNHDESTTILLIEMFYMHYENEPRVTVDRSPRNCHVFKFGNNLIATHHGDKIKLDKLPLVVATDWPEIWGQTMHRVVHTGHIHHDHIKEHPGLITESHGILAPKDAWAAENGYRAKSSMKAIFYHKEHGEVGRNTVTPDMLK
tara:strand:+ start:14 stop:1153 length:1140 start_codon:yes stop_codon:yes gene_type:complete